MSSESWAGMGGGEAGDFMRETWVLNGKLVGPCMGLLEDAYLEEIVNRKLTCQ